MIKYETVNKEVPIFIISNTYEVYKNLNEFLLNLKIQGKRNFVIQWFSVFILSRVSHYISYICLTKGNDSDLLDKYFSNELILHLKFSTLWRLLKS